MSGGQRVLLFGSYAPSLLSFRGPLISAIVERGHQVTAVGGEMDEATATALRELGATPLQLGITNQSLDPFEMMVASRALRRILRDVKPGVLISYTIKPVIVGGLAGGAERVPRIVAMITGAGYAFAGGGGARQRLAKAAATRLYTLALRRSHCTIFQNGDDEALFRELGIIGLGQEVLRVNGSGIDLDRFQAVPLPPQPAFVMVSRLLKAKGVREYAEAGARLLSEHPEAAVNLVGYIDSSPDSITKAELDRIAGSGITFHGRLDDVRPALAAASVFVLPSAYREGVPRSILEALAMGRAIITTDMPGCRETVIDGVNGFLVPPRDSEALYRAMLRFVDEPGLAERMGTESRRLAERKFDVREVNEAVLKAAGL